MTSPRPPDPLDALRQELADDLSGGEAFRDCPTVIEFYRRVLDHFGEAPLRRALAFALGQSDPPAADRAARLEVMVAAVRAGNEPVFQKAQGRPPDAPNT